MDTCLYSEQIHTHYCIQKASRVDGPIDSRLLQPISHFGSPDTCSGASGYADTHQIIEETTNPHANQISKNNHRCTRFGQEFVGITCKRSKSEHVQPSLKSEEPRHNTLLHLHSTTESSNANAQPWSDLKACQVILLLFGVIPFFLRSSTEPAALCETGCLSKKAACFLMKCQGSLIKAASTARRMHSSKPPDRFKIADP